MRRTDQIPLIIMAACFMLNICINNCDEIVEEEAVDLNDNLPGSNNDSASVEATGLNKRNVIMTSFV